MKSTNPTLKGSILILTTTACTLFLIVFLLSADIRMFNNNALSNQTAQTLKTLSNASISDNDFYNISEFNELRDTKSEEPQKVSGKFVTSATSMAVAEVSSGRILNTKNAFLKRPMASTTKIMTAIVAIERLNLDDIVLIDKQMVGIEGSSIYLQAGDKISVRDLLYGLMLRSGNDAATALAIHTAGSVAEFAKLMNETAKRIGAENSNFMNPHGLHHDNHYTTAYDLAMIASYCMRNPVFKEIAGTKVHKAKWEGRDYLTVMQNKNKILFNYEGGTGVKTGFTKKAGRCLVSASERNGMEVVCVVLNCGPMFEDCMQLMTEAHREFKLTEVLSEYNHVGYVPVQGSKTTRINTYTKNALYYPLREGEKSDVYAKVELPQGLIAPVKKDAEIGKIQIYYNNQLLFVEKIYTMEGADTITLKDRLKDIIRLW